MKHPRFAISGSSGYIGSSLCDHLSKSYYCLGISRRISSRNYDVLCLDDLLSSGGVELIRSNNISHFIHCAALAHSRSPRTYHEYRQILRINIDLTVKLALIALNSGVSRFVFISPVGVHVSSSNGFSISETSPIQPENFYAESKALAEDILRSLFDNSSCELVILRPALVYGPDAIGNLRTLKIAVDLCIPFPLTLINNNRSLLALQNLISAVELASLHPSSPGHAYVVADRETISTSALISRIACIRSRPCFQFPVPKSLIALITRLSLVGVKKLRQLVDDLVIDSSKIRNQLGWEQPVSQADAIVNAFSKPGNKFF